MHDRHEADTPDISIDAPRAGAVLMGLVALLTVAGIAMAFVGRSPSSGLAGETVASLHRWFNPDLEANISTWFSTALLLGAAALIGLVARTKWRSDDPLRVHWNGLGLLVLLMSVDEAAQIHEMVIKPTQSLLGASREDAWVWTIPGIVAVCLLLIVSHRFLRGQTPHTRALLLSAIALFFFGAIVIEAFGGAVIGRDRPLAFEVTAAIEEFFEMTGTVVLIYTMMSLLASLGTSVSFAEAVIQRERLSVSRRD